MTYEYKKILVVEDGKIDAQLLKMELEWKGYHPFIARSFKEVVRIVDENNIEGIITDCNYPYVDDGDVVIQTAVDLIGHLVLKGKDNYPLVLTSSDDVYANFAQELDIPFVNKDKGAEKIVNNEYYKWFGVVRKTDIGECPDSEKFDEFIDEIYFRIFTDQPNLCIERQLEKARERYELFNGAIYYDI